MMPLMDLVPLMNQMMMNQMAMVVRIVEKAVRSRIVEKVGAYGM